MLPGNLIRTRSSSTPRQTTREWVCLVRRGHFRSRDKDSIRHIRKRPAARILSGSVLESDLLPIEVLYCWKNSEFRAFICSSDLDLDPMSFISYASLSIWPVSKQTENKLSISRLSKVILSHTDVGLHHRCQPTHYHAASWVVKIFAISIDIQYCDWL